MSYSQNAYNNNGYTNNHEYQPLQPQYSPPPTNIPRQNSSSNQVRHRHHNSNGIYSTDNDTTHSVNLISKLQKRIRNIDLYHKTEADYQITSGTGGIISLISFACITLLILSELFSYFFPPIHHQLKVETRTTDLQQLDIHLNITFPSLTCHQIGIDVMDVSGETTIDSHDNLYRIKLDAAGNWLSEPYLDEVEQEPPMFIINQNGILNLQAGVSSNTQKRRLLQDTPPLEAAAVANAPKPAQSQQQPIIINNIPHQHVGHNAADHAHIQFGGRDTTHDGVGCMLYGAIRVGRVGGNLHIAIGGAHHHSHIPGQPKQHVHNFYPHELAQFNASHVIHTLAFGEPYPGMLNPLDNTQNIIQDGVGHFKYFIKVIPTVYNYALYSVDTNQYSVTNQTIPIRGAIQQQLNQQVLPGLFLIYDFSPFVISISKQDTRFFSLITSMCAIVGGIMAVAGIIDGFVYSISKSLKKR